MKTLISWLLVVWRLLIPKGVEGWIVSVLGVLSLLSLLIFSTGHSFNEYIEVIVENYNDVLNGVLGWVEPALELVLLFILRYFDIQINLSPHWAHIFILLNLYFLRDVQHAWSIGQKSSAISHSGIGFFVSLSSSLIVGLINTSPGKFYEHYIVAIVPILGLFFYAFLGRIWGLIFEPKVGTVIDSETTSNPVLYFIQRVRAAIYRTGAFFVISFILLQTSILEFPNPAIFVFTCIILVFASYFYWEGSKEATALSKESSNAGLTKAILFEQSSWVRVGAMMMRVYLVTFFTIVLTTILHFFRSHFFGQP